MNIKKVYYRIFVSDEQKEIVNRNSIVLSNSNIDSRWIADIVDKARVIKDRYYCDKENRKQLLTYILFLTKKQLYFDDAVLVYGNIKNIPSDRFFNDNLWCELSRFMRKNRYKYMSLPLKMYVEVPKLDSVRYADRSFLVSLQLNIWSVVKESMYAYAENIEKNRKNNSSYWKCMIDKRYRNIKQTFKCKRTSNYYFLAQDKNGRPLFIKCGKNINIETEYKVANYLYNKTLKKELYGFPLLSDSDQQIIVYPYNESETLKNILARRKLDDEEVRMICCFFLELIQDLNKCNVVHRDIHPDNIRVYKDDENRIIRFELIDFGWGCIGSKHTIQTLEEYRDCRYLLGDRYRYSTYAWDDAASVVSLLIQNVSSQQLWRNWDIIEHINSYIGKMQVEM